MAFSWGSLPWGDILGSAVNLGVGLIGANQDKKAAQGAANMATPLPYSGTSMFGNTQFNPGTRTFSLDMAQNPFAQMFNQGGLASLANAYSAPGAGYYGAAPEIAQAAQAMFGPQQQAEAADRLSVLRQIAQPEEQRIGNSLEDKLFARGQTGTTGGGIQMEAYYKALQDADLKRSLASQDWAQSRAMDRFSTALQAVGSGQAGAVNQFNMGTQSQGGIANMFQSLLNQANVGLGAAAGAPPQLAMAANQSPINSTVLPWLKESGLADALGSWIGGKVGGSTPSTYNPGALTLGGNYNVQLPATDWASIQPPNINYGF